MGFKKTLPPFSILTNGVMTGTNVLTSSITNITNLDNIGISVDWTGTAVGTVAIQASVDGTTYHAITFNPALNQPAGTAGGFNVALTEMPFNYLKVTYTNASSTGVLNVKITGKDVN